MVDNQDTRTVQNDKTVSVFTIRHCHVYCSVKRCKFYRRNIRCCLSCQHKVIFHNVLHVPDNGSWNLEISYLFGQSTTGGYVSWVYMTNNTNRWEALRLVPFYVRQKTQYPTKKWIERNRVSYTPYLFILTLLEFT